MRVIHTKRKTGTYPAAFWGTWFFWREEHFWLSLRRCRYRKTILIKWCFLDLGGGQRTELWPFEISKNVRSVVGRQYSYFLHWSHILLFRARSKKKQDAFKNNLFCLGIYQFTRNVLTLQMLLVATQRKEMSITYSLHINAMLTTASTRCPHLAVHSKQDH